MLNIQRVGQRVLTLGNPGIRVVHPRGGAWTPLDLGSSLFLWVRADRGMYQDIAMTTPAGVGDPVAAWADWSGNNRHLTQDMGDRQPLAATTGVTFDGSNDDLKVPLLLSNTFSLCFLVSPDVVDESNLRGLFDSSPNRAYVFRTNNTTWGFWNNPGPGLGTPWGARTRHVVTVTKPLLYEAATYTNGVPVASGAYASWSTSINWLNTRIGTRNLGVEGAFQGTLHEFIMVNRVLTESELSLMDTYLASV